MGSDFEATVDDHRYRVPGDMSDRCADTDLLRIFFGAPSCSTVCVDDEGRRTRCSFLSSAHHFRCWARCRGRVRSCELARHDAESPRENEWQPASNPCLVACSDTECVGWQTGRNI